MTLDMWHMTPDRWGKVNLLSQFKVSIYFGLGWRSNDDIFTKGDSANKLNNHKGVSQTALNKQGLLNIYIYIYI